MKYILILLLTTTSAFSQTVPSNINNAEIHVNGNFQNIIINQSGAGSHTARITSTGDNVPVTVNQSGSTNKWFEIYINCTVSCSTPYVVNQY